MKKKKLEEIIGKNWSGGITKELYKDVEDFNIRISSASIEPGLSKFSEFLRYKRILIILENNVRIFRGKEVINLTQDDMFFFDGNDDIRSQNEKKVLDFNLIWDPVNIDINFNKICGENNLFTNKKIFIFSLDEETNLKFENKEYILSKYDFIEILNKEYKNIKLKGKFLFINWE